MNNAIHFHRWLSGATLGSALLLSACSTTTMEQIRPAPDFQSGRIHRVMVIGVFKNQALRKEFEEEFVRQWTLRGVLAVSSLEVLPSTTTLNKVGVAPIAKAQRFDAVLVSRLLKIQRFGAGKRADLTIDTTAQNEIQNLNTVLQILLAPPAYATPYDLAAVETNLYDVASEKRVWSGISETTMIGKVSKLIRPFIKVILKSLYQNP